MPTIIDYSAVMERMTGADFRCNYPNSGAFGFVSQPLVRGWTGAADSTIRPGLLAEVRQILPPYEINLAAAAGRVWQAVLPGPAWIMPLSHWHFELHDGSRHYLPEAMKEVNVDAQLLQDRADGSAIEFSPGESFEPLVAALLENLRVSDFLLAFPGRAALCTIHHHKQLWWTTTEAALLAQIDSCLTPMVR